MYKHYVFDIDGTLIDSEAAAMRSLQRVVREMQGREVPLEQLYGLFGMSAGDTMAWLGIDDGETGLRLWHQYIHELWHLTTVFDGIPPVLDALKTRGASLGLLTSKTRFEYERDFLPLGIGPYFGTVITADDSETHKPQPGPMLAYMDKSGARAEDILFIGDTVHDMGCGKSAGVDHALALWGRRTNDEAIKATFRLSYPSDLLNL